MTKENNPEYQNYLLAIEAYRVAVNKATEAAQALQKAQDDAEVARQATHDAYAKHLAKNYPETYALNNPAK